MNKNFENTIFYLFLIPFPLTESLVSIVAGKYNHFMIEVEPWQGRLFGLICFSLVIYMFRLNYLEFNVVKKSYHYIISMIKSGFLFTLISLIAYKFYYINNPLDYDWLIYIGLLLLCAFSQYIFIHMLRKIIVKNESNNGK